MARRISLNFACSKVSVCNEGLLGLGLLCRIPQEFAYIVRMCRLGFIGDHLHLILLIEFLKMKEFVRFLSFFIYFPFFYKKIYL